MNVDVPGKIHKVKYWKFWKEVLEAPEFVLETLDKRYELPFHTLPPPSMEKNNASAAQERTCHLYGRKLNGLKL